MSADNAATVSTDVVILNYACINQGGYVYAVDDSTPITGSINGKVAALTDQVTPGAPGINWSSDSSGGGSFIAIYGISELSTSTLPNPNSGQVAG